MPYLLLALAACFWGGNYVIGRLLVSQVDPIVLSALRWWTTAILLMILYFRQVKQQWSAIKRAKGIVFFLALCGQVLFPLTLYIGLQYTSSLNAAIYLSTTPAMVLLINRLIFHEHISAGNIVGVILSSCGVIWLILQGNVMNWSTLRNLNQGDLWTMGSAMSWAAYCAFLRLKPKTVAGNGFVAISASVGAIMLLPVMTMNTLQVADLDLAPYLTLNFLLGLAYLVIFPSWLAYLLWNKGIAAIGATRGEVFSHLIPLSGGLFSILFLHSPLYAYHLISGLAIVCGIALCSRSRRVIAPQAL